MENHAFKCNTHACLNLYEEKRNVRTHRYLFRKILIKVYKRISHRGRLNLGDTKKKNEVRNGKNNERNKRFIDYTREFIPRSCTHN